MITWIQTRLQNHLKVIFFTLLMVLIVAFVLTIGNIPGIGIFSGSSNRHDFYGYDLNAKPDIERLFNKAALSLALDTGLRAASSQNQIEEAALRREALLHLADQLQIPNPDTAQLTAFIRSKPLFMEQGKFSEKQYSNYLERLQSQDPARAQLLPLVLNEDFRINKIGELIKGPGYSLPFEAQKQLEFEKTLWSLEVAVFDLATFTPEIEIPLETLTSYYDTNAPAYETPEKVKTAFVLFSADRYRERVSQPTEQELSDYFKNHKSAYAAPTDEAAAPETTPAFEDVREAVMADVVQEKAKRLALKAADDFAYHLFEQSIQRASEAFTQLLTENALTLSPIPPYSRDALPSQDLPEALLSQAFDLTQERYYSDAYPTADGAALLFLKKRIPPKIPPFEIVQEQVTADYRQAEKQRLFNEHGSALHKDLVQALQNGKTFVEAVEGHPLAVKTYTGFTVETTPTGLSPSLLSSLQPLLIGEVSPMLFEGGKGHFIHVTKREPPTLDPESPEIQTRLNRLEFLTKLINQRSITAELITRGLNP